MFCNTCLAWNLYEMSSLALSRSSPMRNSIVLQCLDYVALAALCKSKWTCVVPKSDSCAETPEERPLAAAPLFECICLRLCTTSGPTCDGMGSGNLCMTGAALLNSDTAPARHVACHGDRHVCRNSPNEPVFAGSSAALEPIYVCPSAVQLQDVSAPRRTSHH